MKLSDFLIFARKRPPFAVPSDQVAFSWDDDLGAFFVKKSDGSETPIGGAPHTHVSADVTDAVSDASGILGTNGKLLKVTQFALLAPQVTVGEFVAKVDASNYSVFKKGGVDSVSGGSLIFDADFPQLAGAGGTHVFAALRYFADSTAADAVVSIGDAWWDTTLNKARVRLV